MRLLKALLLGLVVTSCGCDYMDGTNDRRRQRAAEEVVWNDHCADVSWLLATTAGSPDKAVCPNKAHRMRVQVATTASNEEVGALVFCECLHPEDGGT